ncbi:MAG: DUF4335 domain-containing protein [Richelia sp. CSU_2_1]|nr:DUF4335 domain-containing protein [Microcoleus sp. SU_5_3]NJR26255.1 DUF4335 domain-containing protein [Richelia sp. CSU_2_1]
MTIRRQYSLPNCTLVLEGLSDGSAASQLDIRPVLSILMSAECYLTSLAEPLTGGRDFFESLLKAVSSYAQEFMSGVHYPDRHGHDLAMVQLHKIDANLHRLTVLSAVADNGTQIDEKIPLAAEVNLTTVQLFDLVEAIDQFFADTQTLPELSLQLTPVSKRYVKSAEPVAKRALPAAVGVSSLALAAMAFFLVPVPEVQRPQDPVPRPNAAGQNLGTPTPDGGSGSPNPTPTPDPTPDPTPTPASDGLLPGDRTPKAESGLLNATPTPIPDASPSVSPSPVPEGLQSPEATVAPITDPAEIDLLKGKLAEKIDEVLKDKPAIESESVYRVSVGKDGAIVGYKPENSATVDRVGDALLSDLLFKPIDTRPPAEPLADFRVVFVPGGSVQVSPW